jgi:hypothetical protein
MPTYTFFNELAGVEYEDFMSISEYTQFMKDNPHIKRVWDSAPAIVGDHISAAGPKNDAGFKENMQRIAAAHPDSPMSDRWGGSSRTHKEIKTKSAIDKHAKKVAKDGWSSNKILTGSVGSSRRKNK